MTTLDIEYEDSGNTARTLSSGADGSTPARGERAGPERGRTMNQHATVYPGVDVPGATNGYEVELQGQAPGVTLQRYFTRAGISPYDEVVWEKRQALITGEDGAVVFEQHDVDFPQFWSQMATNMVASKYFRGPLGTPQREYSVRQLISVSCIHSPSGDSAVATSPLRPMRRSLLMN